MPRPQPATSILAVIVALPALLLPIRTLVTEQATPDAFMTVPLLRLLHATSPGVTEAVWLLGGAFLIVVAVFLPARAAIAIPLGLALVLAGSSVVSSAEVAERARTSNEKFFGTAARSWVDEAAVGPVTYLDTGSVYWNGIWKTGFWNERIEHVAHFTSTLEPGAPAGDVTARADGTLVDAGGRPLPTREVVASSWLTFFGEQVAQIAQVDTDLAGLTLWRTLVPGPRACRR